MKTVKQISLLLCGILLGQCSSWGEYEIPDQTSLKVTTNAATKVGVASAELSLTVTSDKMVNPSGYFTKAGFYLSSNGDMSGAQLIPASGGTTQSAVATGLTAQTLYYFQGFIEDRFGNQIKGEVLSFTTIEKTQWATVTTLVAQSVGGGTVAVLHLSANPSQEPVEFSKAGFYMDVKPEMDNPTIINASGSWPNFAAEALKLTPQTTYYYQGYVESKDGERILGKIVSFTTKIAKELWIKVPNSENSSIQGYTYGYSTENRICLMIEDGLWEYGIGEDSWQSMSAHRYVYPMASAPYHGNGLFITKENRDATTMTLWYSSSNDLVKLADLPFLFNRGFEMLFVCGKNVYIFDDNLTIWEYDWNGTLTHLENSEYPGNGTAGLSGFASYNEKIIFGLGWNPTVGMWCNDLWEYDTRTYKWKRLTDFPGALDSLPWEKWTCFTLNGNVTYGYFITHATTVSSNVQNSWTYDVATDSWTFIEDNGNFPFYDKQGCFFGSDVYILNKEGLWKFVP